MATYTYAILEVSKAAFEEIEEKLKKTGIYDGAFPSDGVIDMHGIGIQKEGTPSLPKDDIIYERKERKVISPPFSEEDVIEILKRFAEYVDHDKVQSPSIYRKIVPDWYQQVIGNKSSKQ